MNTATTWDRPHFSPGGGNALLFYVVFGPVDATAPLSRGVYRTERVPETLVIAKYGPDCHPEVLDSFRSGYLWEKLQSEDPALAAHIATQDQCLVIKGTFDDPETLAYLRDTVGLLTHFLDHGGVAIYDPQMFAWWNPAKWKERIFAPAAPVPRHHTVILVSEDDGSTEWLHTRGLRKFGRPDLSIHRVPSNRREAVVDMINRFIEMQAFGGVVPEGHEIKMRSLPAGMRCEHRGDLDDPDFNNVHLEITHEQ